jgi:hypothetical protein
MPGGKEERQRGKNGGKDEYHSEFSLRLQLYRRYIVDITMSLDYSSDLPKCS